MKTKKKVLEENPHLSKLINAVIKNIGMDAVSDVNNHGIDGGFHGFIYYVDTHKFAVKHRETIIEMLEQLADDMGQEVTEVVAGFGVFRNSKMDSDDRRDLYRYLGGGKCEPGTITNIMAWFAAEEVCRLFED